jgi:hypothetical protein
MSDPRFEIAFPRPANLHSQIWRYMDLWKLNSMLEHQGLFFCRLDKLGDPFEGAMPAPDHQGMREQYSQAVMNASADFTKNYSLRRVMVNCWHMNEGESAAMWALYASRGEAVCIQSTFQRLEYALGDSVTGVGMVMYIDYRTEKMKTNHPFYSRFLHKRKSFEHEREVRAVVYNRDGDIPVEGEFRRVDLSVLIESVFLAPTSEGSLETAIRGLLRRFRLDVPVQRSSLADDPIF